MVALDRRVWPISRAVHVDLAATVRAGPASWGVKAFDTAGNEGAGQTIAASITSPPSPPAPLPNMTRLEYTYIPSTKQVTLSWNASPSA